VRTTINTLVDRRGGAYSESALNETLTRARKLLADTSAFLELEIDRLYEVEIEDEPGRIKQVKDLIAQVQKCMQTVLDLEVKHGLKRDAADALNLEDARNEILRRLARLAA